MGKKPNLLFFGVDSLRRNRMSLYGYPRLNTPHLDKYAKGGAVFTQCFSASIPTTSGYSCMLTGRDCFGTDVVALRHKGDLAPGVVTLAEILSGQGYNSSCVGFRRSIAGHGFQNYIDFSGWSSTTDGRAHKAENLNAVAIPELRKLAAEKDKPFFLFLRHMDPHSPYLPPAPYERMFYAGDECDKNNKSLEACYNFKPFCDYVKSFVPAGCTDAEYINAQYDSAVAYMDTCIQSIFTELNTLGLEEDTLVVFTSDHGETLDDHQFWYDHHGLYDCTLVVPLVFRMPGTVPAGARYDDHCQLKDITPTVLDLLGISYDGDKWEGRSLYPRIQGGTIVQEPEFYITECTWERKHGWRTPHYKLIRALEPDFHYLPPVELYDLVKDPGENNNIAEQEPGMVTELTRRMEAFITKREKETGRTNPMYTNLGWHGKEGKGPFKTSDEAYNTMYIGDREAARRLQAEREEKK